MKINFDTHVTDVTTCLLAQALEGAGVPTSAWPGAHVVWGGPGTGVCLFQERGNTHKCGES